MKMAGQGGCNGRKKRDIIRTARYQKMERFGLSRDGEN